MISGSGADRTLSFSSAIQHAQSSVTQAAQAAPQQTQAAQAAEWLVLNGELWVTNDEKLMVSDEG